MLNIYRRADGLPQPQRTELQRLAGSYVDAVINEDWPQMARNEAPDQSTGISREMWKTVMLVRATSPTAQTLEDLRCRN